MTMFDSRWLDAKPHPKRLLAFKTRPEVLDEFARHSVSLSESSLLLRDARLQLEKIRETDALGEMHEELAQWTVDLLRRIASNSTVYPSIAPDFAGGLALHWVANHLSLEIEIDSDRCYSFAAYNHDEIVASGEGRGLPPTEQIRDHLTRLTRYVEVRNPSWREHFA